ncbi:MAG: agmatinase [Desulfarculaceae bacterium]
MKSSSNLITFGGVPQPDPESARAAIIPVPFEASVSYGRGTSLGPAALLHASGYMELYDELLGMEPVSRGILTLPAIEVNADAKEVLKRIQEAVQEQLNAGRLPALIGGEHTVSLGALRALAHKFGTGFTVMVLDAHLDLRDSYQGNDLSHACVMKRALDLGLQVRHVGVRSCSSKEAELVDKIGLKPVWAHEIGPDRDWIERSLDGVEGPIYLSLDLDGLDTSIMPATGTPEPGGLTWHQVSNWLVEVCKRHQVLGLDIVELAPLCGQAAWSFTAARLLYRALGLALEGTP